MARLSIIRILCGMSLLAALATVEWEVSTVSGSGG